MSFRDVENLILQKTEYRLRRRRWRALVRQQRRFGPAVVLDWVFTIIFIIIAVILINMFVFQNYRIPTGSMVPTLQIGDLLIVEKMTFGPEILPGRLKLPPVRAPRRGEIVSFESELYAERGPVVELIDRFVYFITLSLVNLKTNERNEAIVDLLIKRVIGLPGDRVREYRGRFEVLPAAETAWVEEKALMEREGIWYSPVISNYDRPAPFYKRGLSRWLDRLAEGGREPAPDPGLDYNRSAFQQSPQSADSRSEWIKRKLGCFVPEGAFFPMGDNRPNSRDARDYGPVRQTHIQGKAVFRFFPIPRFGVIEE